jgi:cardiolipin synthase (CMP-forming)
VTWANRITLMRIILAPVIIIGLLHGDEVWPTALFIVSALSDLLDGAVARWRGEHSVLGSFLDPVADKLLLVSTYLVLAHLGLVPMWVFVVVFSRDLLILVGWNIIAILTQNTSLTPRWLGKSTTFLEMTAAAALLIAPAHPVARLLFWSMIVVTSASTIDYVWVGARKLSQLDQGVSFSD